MGQTKTPASSALVAVPECLSVELQSWFEASGRPPGDTFIFPSRKGGPLDAHNYLRRDVLRPTTEKLGIEGVTFQCLRRTFATHFHGVGTIKDQQAQMRHADAMTTMNVYTQVVRESVRSAVELFAQKMSEGSGHNWSQAKKGGKRK